LYKTAYHSEPLNNLSFLVTGGAGFIGSNLVEYLLTFGAAKVKVLDNFSTGYLHNLAPWVNYPNLEIITGDIRDLQACMAAAQGADIILHQAALGSVPRSLSDPITTNEVNISGFLNMLMAARDARVRRFVYAASSSTYGDSPTLPKKEEQIGNPLSPYAVTKYVNELYAGVFARTWGLPCIGLRYFNVFGPRQDPNGAYAAVIPLFINLIKQGKAPLINGSGEHTRDFTFVENAVQANIKAALTGNQEAINQVFNVAVGEQNSLNQLVALVKLFTNSNINPVHGPERAGDIRDSLANIAKAEKLLGYKPEIGFQQGLEKTVNWYNYLG
jgi:UDP-N-acetylglucosamine/UDP-N-acetylgalactosamine 4-epimerase